MKVDLVQICVPLTGAVCNHLNVIKFNNDREGRSMARKLETKMNLVPFCLVDGDGSDSDDNPDHLDYGLNASNDMNCCVIFCLDPRDAAPFTARTNITWRGYINE